MTSYYNTSGLSSPYGGAMTPSDGNGFSMPNPAAGWQAGSSPKPFLADGPNSGPGWGASAPGGMGSFFGSSAGSGMGGSYSSNPYLGQMAQGIQGTLNQNLTQNLLPAIQSGAIAAGGLGGSRQGVAQGVAMGNTQTGLANALGNLYGSDWNNGQNRALSQYQGDQNFFSQQRAQDQSGAMVGANLYNMGINGQWAPINNANNVYGNYTGFGNTTGSSQQGGGAQGAVGGALSGATFGHQMGWW